MSELEAGDDFRTLIEQELQMRLKLPGASEPISPAPATAAATAEAEASPVAAPSCAGCGTNNDPDAQFCKKCGAKL